VQRLLAAGEHVCAYRSEDTWFDLGTISEYERAVAELERRGGSLV
jgi:NDP-sugar pyrophosphorylase family protein